MVLLEPRAVLMELREVHHRYIDNSAMCMPTTRSALLSIRFHLKIYVYISLHFATVSYGMREK